HPYSKGLIASLPALRPAARGARLPAIGGRPANLAALPSGCFFHPRCPFAAPRCRIEPQKIINVNDGRSVRCWQEGALGEWPLVAASATAPASAPGAPLIRAANLHKRFARAKGLAALRLEWSGRLPRLRYQPAYTIAIDAMSMSIDIGETL